MYAEQVFAGDVGKASERGLCFGQPGQKAAQRQLQLADRAGRSVSRHTASQRSTTACIRGGVGGAGSA